MGQLDKARVPGCELCESDGGTLIVRTNKLRVIRAHEPDHPAFYRVIWNDHVAEWTDLAPPDRSHLMQAVAKVETVMRQLLAPTKINLASLGNMVPHLHWHVIARFDGDARWPAPVWAPKNQSADGKEAPEGASFLSVPLSTVDDHIAQVLAAH
jgi:diadenosine tetraphosphate (Ap4A) HIT family hydrolase